MPHLHFGDFVRARMRAVIHRVGVWNRQVRARGAQARNKGRNIAQLGWSELVRSNAATEALVSLAYVMVLLVFFLISSVFFIGFLLLFAAPQTLDWLFFADGARRGAASDAHSEQMLADLYGLIDWDPRSDADVFATRTHAQQAAREIPRLVRRYLAAIRERVLADITEHAQRLRAQPSRSQATDLWDFLHANQGPMTILGVVFALVGFASNLPVPVVVVQLLRAGLLLCAVFIWIEVWRQMPMPQHSSLRFLGFRCGFLLVTIMGFVLGLLALSTLGIWILRALGIALIITSLWIAWILWRAAWHHWRRSAISRSVSTRP